MHEIKTIIFDLDNTLYPEEVGLLREVDSRISDFILKKFNIKKEK